MEDKKILENHQELIKKIKEAPSIKEFKQSCKQVEKRNHWLGLLSSKFVSIITHILSFAISVIVAHQLAKKEPGNIFVQIIDTFKEHTLVSYILIFLSVIYVVLVIVGIINIFINNNKVMASDVWHDICAFETKYEDTEKFLKGQLELNNHLTVNLKTKVEDLKEKYNTYYRQKIKSTESQLLVLQMCFKRLVHWTDEYSIDDKDKIRKGFYEDFLGLIKEHAQTLFSFDDSNQWSLSLYFARQTGTKANNTILQCSKAFRVGTDSLVIKDSYRSWRFGEGFVGNCFKDNQRKTCSSFDKKDLERNFFDEAKNTSDIDVYKSIICQPISRQISGSDIKYGVISLTSSEDDHFKSSQPIWHFLEILSFIVWQFEDNLKQIQKTRDEIA